MSASLVGSEMCIRDRLGHLGTKQERPQLLKRSFRQAETAGGWDRSSPEGVRRCEAARSRREHHRTSAAASRGPAT
eukprot:183588-Alexandrium_andersonii.AAC.1